MILSTISSGELIFALIALTPPSTQKCAIMGCKKSPATSGGS